jgi:predicted SAM-dependent methyltransferase
VTRVLRVNVGCGPLPIPGWENLDNSPSVAIARLPRWCTSLLERVRLIRPEQARVVDVARAGAIRRGRAEKLPFADGAAAVVYSSHMLEHLGRDEAKLFLHECHRVLHAGGILRLVVPDLERYVRAYVQDGDANQLIDGLHMAQSGGNESIVRRLFVGFRGHRWMYDGLSLKTLVEEAGFENVELLPPGKTGLDDPAGLDLREREEDSLYLEARRGAASPTPGAAQVDNR